MVWYYFAAGIVPGSRQSTIEARLSTERIIKNEEKIKIILRLTSFDAGLMEQH
jgi:hypothetical protein